MFLAALPAAISVSVEQGVEVPIATGSSAVDLEQRGKP